MEGVAVSCLVHSLWDFPGQSKVKHVHLVHTLFLGRKVVSRKKFAIAYVQDKKKRDVFIPHDSGKAEVTFDEVDVQEGLLLVTSVVKNLKKGKQVLSSLVVDLWDVHYNNITTVNKELDFAPHGKGIVTLRIGERAVTGLDTVSNVPLGRVRKDKSKLDTVQEVVEEHLEEGPTKISSTNTSENDNANTHCTFPNELQSNLETNESHLTVAHDYDGTATKGQNENVENNIQRNPMLTQFVSNTLESQSDNSLSHDKIENEIVDKHNPSTINNKVCNGAVMNTESDYERRSPQLLVKSCSKEHEVTCDSDKMQICDQSERDGEPIQAMGSCHENDINIRCWKIEVMGLPSDSEGNIIIEELAVIKFYTDGCYVLLHAGDNNGNGAVVLTWTGKQASKEQIAAADIKANQLAQVLTIDPANEVAVIRSTEGEESERLLKLLPTAACCYETPVVEQTSQLCISNREDEDLNYTEGRKSSGDHVALPQSHHCVDGEGKSSAFSRINKLSDRRHSYSGEKSSTITHDKNCVRRHSFAALLSAADFYKAISPGVSLTDRTNDNVSVRRNRDAELNPKARMDVISHRKVERRRSYSGATNSNAIVPRNLSGRSFARRHSFTAKINATDFYHSITEGQGCLGQEQLGGSNSTIHKSKSSDYSERGSEKHIAATMGQELTRRHSFDVNDSLPNLLPIMGRADRALRDNFIDEANKLFESLPPIQSGKSTKSVHKGIARRHSHNGVIKTVESTKADVTQVTTSNKRSHSFHGKITIEKFHQSTLEESPPRSSCSKHDDEHRELLPRQVENISPTFSSTKETEKPLLETKLTSSEDDTDSGDAKPTTTGLSSLSQLWHFTPETTSNNSVGDDRTDDRCQSQCTTDSGPRHLSPRARSDSFIEDENLRFSIQSFPSFTSNKSPSPVIPVNISRSYSNCDYDDDSTLGSLNFSDCYELNDEDIGTFDDEEYYNYECDSNGDEKIMDGELFFSDDDESCHTPSPEPTLQECIDMNEEVWEYDMDAIEEYCTNQLEAHADVQRTHHQNMAISPTRVTRVYSGSKTKPRSKRKHTRRLVRKNSSSKSTKQRRRRNYFKGWAQAPASKSFNKPTPQNVKGQSHESVELPESESDSPDVNIDEVNLYRIGYINEKLHVSRMAGLDSNDVDFGPPSRFMLLPKGVYIIDQPDAVFVWTGRKSPGQLRAAGITFAKALIQHSRTFEEGDILSVEGVLEGEESMFFRKHFPDWVEWENEERSKKEDKGDTATDKSHMETFFGMSSPIGKKGGDGWINDKIARGASLTEAETSSASVSNPKTLSRGVTAPIPHMTWSPMKSKGLVRRQSTVVGVVDEEEAEPETPFHILLGRDEGQGEVIVWKIHENGMFVKVSEVEVGHFWVHETYVILYGFTPDIDEVHQRSKWKPRPEFVLYFWQGPHGKPVAYTQWKLTIFPQKKDEWMESMGRVPKEIRVSQSKEPIHFLKIFRRRYCVHFPFIEILEERKEKAKGIRKNQMQILGREKERDVVRSQQESRLPAFLRAAVVRSSGKVMTQHNRRCANSTKRTVIGGNDEMAFATAKRSIYKMEQSAGVLCFHVRGTGIHDADVHAVQIEASTCRLTSSDCFITLRPLPEDKSCVWLWVGRGTQYSEQEAAGALAQRLRQWFEPDRKCGLRVIEDGAVEWVERWTAKAFYRAMGGLDIYSNSKLLRVPRDERPQCLRYPTLFLCSSTGGDNYSVRKLRRYSQIDLESSSAAILDAHFAVFVWTGRVCSPHLANMALNVAKKYFEKMRRGHIQLKRKVIPVQQDNELISFVSCFHGWCDWPMLEKTFVDPWEVRCEVRTTLGLEGEIRVGKVTTAVPTKLSTEENGKHKAEKRPQPTAEEIRERARSSTKSSEAKRREPVCLPVNSSSTLKPWSIKSPERSLIAMPITFSEPLDGDNNVSTSDANATDQGTLKRDRSDSISKKLFSSFMSIDTKHVLGAKKNKNNIFSSPLSKLRERLRKGNEHSDNSGGGFNESFDVGKSMDSDSAEISYQSRKCSGKHCNERDMDLLGTSNVENNSDWDTMNGQMYQSSGGTVFLNEDENYSIQAGFDRMGIMDNNGKCEDMLRGKKISSNDFTVISCTSLRGKDKVNEPVSQTVLSIWGDDDETF